MSHRTREGTFSFRFSDYTTWVRSTVETQQRWMLGKDAIESQRKISLMATLKSLSGNFSLCYICFFFLSPSTARRSAVSDRVHSHWRTRGQWWGLWESFYQNNINPSCMFLCLGSFTSTLAVNWGVFTFCRQRSRSRLQPSGVQNCGGASWRSALLRCPLGSVSPRKGRLDQRYQPGKPDCLKALKISLMWD